MEIKINITDEFVKNTIKDTVAVEIRKMLGQSFNQLSNNILVNCLEKRMDKYISKCEKDGHFYHILANNIVDKLNVNEIMSKFDEEEMKKMISDRLAEILIKTLNK